MPCCASCCTGSRGVTDRVELTEDDVARIMDRMMRAREARSRQAASLAEDVERLLDDRLRLLTVIARLRELQ